MMISIYAATTLWVLAFAITLAFYAYTWTNLREYRKHLNRVKNQGASHFIRLYSRQVEDLELRLKETLAVLIVLFMVAVVHAVFATY